MKNGSGILAGLISCTLAILGILTVGYIFIPLAALVALVGTFISLVNFNTSGIGVNILAWILTGIGIVTSPALLAIIGAALLISTTQSDESKHTVQIHSADIELNEKLPLKQTEIKAPAKTRVEIIEPSNTEQSMENIMFEQLQASLSKIRLVCQSSSDCEIDGFRLVPIDINHDDKYEFIVTHNDYCGAGGCTTLLISESADKKWSITTSTFGSIEGLTSITNGYIDIRYVYKIYPPDKPWYMAAQKLSWSGLTYIETGKMEPLH